LLACAALAGCVSLRPWNEAAQGLAPERFVRVGEQLVSVEQAGEGQPLVLLHGFGYTQRPRERSAYTLDGQERLVLGVLDQLGIDRARLAGHSYGGGLALHLAATHPGRFERLLLIDNTLPLFASARRSPLFRWRWVSNLAVRTFGLSDSRIAWGLRESYHDDTLVTPELVGDYAKRLRIEGAVDAFRGLIGPSDEPPRELDLATIRQPTLVVWGEEDRLIDVAGARERSAAIPGGRFVSIPDCGHAPMEECPEAFLEAVLPFLEAP